jgi:hypothetical protein
MLQVLLSLSGLFFSLSQFNSASEENNILNEASFLARNLVEHIGAAIVTLGRLGVLVSSMSFLFEVDREREKERERGLVLSSENSWTLMYSIQCPILLKLVSV